MKETVLLLSVVLLAYLLGAYAGYAQGYYDGQIDALTGTVKYELVVQKDKSTDWVKKD